MNTNKTLIQLLLKIYDRAENLKTYFSSTKELFKYIISRPSLNQEEKEALINNLKTILGLDPKVIYYFSDEELFKLIEDTHYSDIPIGVFDHMLTVDNTLMFINSVFGENAKDRRLGGSLKGMLYMHSGHNFNEFRNCFKEVCDLNGFPLEEDHLSFFYSVYNTLNESIEKKHLIKPLISIANKYKPEMSYEEKQSIRKEHISMISSIIENPHTSRGDFNNLFYYLAKNTNGHNAIFAMLEIISDILKPNDDSNAFRDSLLTLVTETYWNNVDMDTLTRNLDEIFIDVDRVKAGRIYTYIWDMVMEIKYMDKAHYESFYTGVNEYFKDLRDEVDCYNDKEEQAKNVIKSLLKDEYTENGFLVTALIHILEPHLDLINDCLN